MIELKCSKCLFTMDESMFHVDRQKKTGRRSRCKDCERKHVNRERRSVYEKKYWDKRRDDKRDIVRKSCKKNKEKHKKKRQEYLKTERGKEVYRRYTQKRYAAMKGAFVESVNPLEIYKDQKGICYICKEEFDFDKMELDHVHPIVNGGKHEKANCKMACMPCNRSKGAKPLNEVTYQMV